jgi:beta-mannosidase
LDDEDPDNYYWPTSPSQSVATNATINQGDIHYWNVWAGKADIEDYNLFVGRFNSEYGMQGILEMSSIKRFTIPSDWDETSQTMELHERHVVGWPTINYYLNEYYKPVKDFQTKVYVSQIM